MRFQYNLLGCALALAGTAVNAQNATSCPGEGICFTVNVPTSGKDLFFQISGPSSMSWIGFGQGSAMKDSNIFVIYANSAGTNVTLSPRSGTGRSMPQSNTNTQVTLLDGSKVSGDMMVANVKCSNCQSWSGGTMDFTSTSTSWIYAYKSGTSLKSDNVGISINRHDDTGLLKFNLASATGGDGTVNPFTTAVTASNSPSSPGSGSSSNGGYGSPASSNDNKNSTSSSDLDFGPETTLSRSTKAHGIMGAAVFTLLFPSGSIILRILPFKNVIWVHVGIQIFSYLVALAVLETGIWVAVQNQQLMLTHPIIGLIAICALFFQPFLGLGHHLLYKRQGGPNILTQPHIWWGRVFITLGIINGFLGLKLAEQNATVRIAYVVVAGVVWALWMGLSLLHFLRNRRRSASGAEKGLSKSAIRRIDGDDSMEMMNFQRR